MKKIIFLSACIFALLLLGISDMRLQKKARGPAGEPEAAAVSAGGSVIATETAEKTDTGAQEYTIRVLLKNDHFESEYHDSLLVSSQNGFTVSDGTRVWEVGAQEQKEINPQSEEFAKSDVLSLKSADAAFCLPQLLRERSSSIYEGTLEIRRTGQGLLVINILPLEKYLCGVVPSEMPSSYPQEALKAQAVCARTYALRQIGEGRAEEYFADVDDSVSYQVYNNQDRSESTDRAVMETTGCILAGENGIEETLYYSTSCGLDAAADLSGETVFAALISENNIRAYESQEPWYRWTAEASLGTWQNAVSLEVQERGHNGRAESLCVTDSAGAREYVEGEYNIRKFLAEGVQKVVLQDGEELEGMELLPSAFFILEEMYEDGSLTGYRIRGGGYGHGDGMSQNGAKYMALDGCSYTEILQTYYPQAETADMEDYL